MKAVIFDDVLATLDHHYRVAGLELAFFEHGDQAEAVVAQERPDLIFVDYTMDAQRSGAEVIIALRCFQGAPRLRIIAISSDREHNERMLVAGADDALPKSHLRGYLKKLAERADMAARLR